MMLQFSQRVGPELIPLYRGGVFRCVGVWCVLLHSPVDGHLFGLFPLFGSYE